MATGLQWAFGALAFVVVPLFSLLIVRRYRHDRSASPLTTSVTTAALSASLLCVLLVPVDIYTVSSSLTSDGLQTDPSRVRQQGEAVKALYYILYSVLLALAFGLMPFAYFYHEEDDDEVSTKDKVCGALKYTTLFIVFFAVLIGLGILLRHGQFDSNGKPDQEWISKLRGNFDAGDAILSFCIGVLASLGLFGWLWYTTYGLSHMPVSLMRSTYASVEPDSSVKGLDRDEVQRKLQRLQTELDFIGKRYDGQARAWSDADRKRKQQLDVEKRALEAQLRKLQRKQEGRGSVKSRCITCWRATAPLRITVGLAMLALSGLVLASLAISTIDKAMHSDCKAKCGYTLDKPRVTNPIDWALNQLSPYFPIDFALYAGVTFFIFLCTISALVDRGVGLLCWKLYEVKKERTEPHGLILGTWLITFTVLLLNMQLLTLAPQYTTFGRQFYIEIDAATNATRHVACEVSRTALNSNVTAGDAAHCAMTQVATFINSLQLAMPFFGAIFYFVNYAFLGLALLAVAYVFLRKPVSTAGYQEIEEVDDF